MGIPAAKRSNAVKGASRRIATPYNSGVNRAPRFCYAGTYEQGYPRNWLTAEALRDAGVRVEEAHVPVWERLRDKSGAGPRQLARVALGLALAYGRLVPEVAVRLLRCDGLAVGYIGQLDMLALGPVAKLMRKPVIFDPLVTLTDTIVEDRRLVSPRSPLAWVIRQVDRAALRLAAVVLSDTAENARYMHDTFKIPLDRIVILPVGADEVIFYENKGAVWNDATTERPLDVLFYGKFIPLHGIETIIRAARIVEERDIQVRFELVGTGQTYQETRDLARALGVGNITWTDWIPYLGLGNRLREADVALGVFSSGAKAGRVVPNKVYQSLASRVATVTRENDALCVFDKPLPNPSPTKGGALGRAIPTVPPFSGEGLGRGLSDDGAYALLIAPDDPAALADAIERLCDGETRQRIAKAGFAAYNQAADYKARRNIMASVIERVMEGKWQRQPGRG
jgi:glycosyltransferase involved in cell wall biosynthesis